MAFAPYSIFGNDSGDILIDVLKLSDTRANPLLRVRDLTGLGRPGPTEAFILQLLPAAKRFGA